MPVCTNCNYEYIDGIVICPDCKTPLVQAVELELYDELGEDDWVLVYTSFNEIDVEMLIDNLESAGIAATMLSQKDRNFPAPGDFSVVKLMVKKADVQQALDFITTVKTQENSNEEENGDQ